MRRLKVNQHLMLALWLALLPIAALSIWQGLTTYRYAEGLIRKNLIISALATATMQRGPVIDAQRAMEDLARDTDVYNMTQKCSDALRSIPFNQQQIVAFVRSDRTGNVRCSGIQIDRPISFALEKWWQKTARARTFSLSRPIIGQVSKRRVVIAARPLLDPISGQFEGMITAGISLDWIETALRQTTLSPQAIVGIADRDGLVVISPTQNILGRINVKSSFNSVNMVTAKNGQSWLYSSAPIYDQQLYVVYAEPQNLLSSGVQSQLRTAIILPLLTIVFASLALWIAINQSIGRWLKQLHALANQFARGDFSTSQKLFETAPVDIRQFSNDFHDMAEAIEQRNLQIITAFASSQAMAREVNHRVKNNLQLILSLISLQSSHVKEHSGRAALTQTHKRVATLGLIYRLMYDDDNTNTAEQGQVNLQRLFNELCGQLRTDAIGQNNVTVRCSAPSVVRSVDMAIPLALFVVEAVTNAYRHAFEGSASGAINVTLMIASKSVLTITDDGIGFKLSANAPEMGMKLLNAFATQLNGQMTIYSEGGNGARIELIFSEFENQ